MCIDLITPVGSGETPWYGKGRKEENRNIANVRCETMWIRVRTAALLPTQYPLHVFRRAPPPREPMSRSLGTADGIEVLAIINLTSIQTCRRRDLYPLVTAVPGDTRKRSIAQLVSTYGFTHTDTTRTQQSLARGPCIAIEGSCV